MRKILMTGLLFVVAACGGGKSTHHSSTTDRDDLDRTHTGDSRRERPSKNDFKDGGIRFTQDVDLCAGGRIRFKAGDSISWSRARKLFKGVDTLNGKVAFELPASHYWDRRPFETELVFYGVSIGVAAEKRVRFYDRSRVRDGGDRRHSRGHYDEEGDRYGTGGSKTLGQTLQHPWAD